MRSSLRACLAHPMAKYLPGRVKSLLRARTNPPVFPVLLQIEPTRKCNLKCQMCTRTHEPLASCPDMTLDFFKKVISQFPPELEAVHIQGLGEPLLNADIMEMIQFARSRGLRTSFNTNLTYLTDEMARRLVELGHSEIIVSVETVDPELYEELRRNARLERVLGNIRKLNEEKKRQNSQYPLIKAHSILMKHLLPSFPDLIRTCRELGLENVHFIDFITRGVDPEVRLSSGERLVDMVLHATMSEEEIRHEIGKLKSLQDETFQVSVPGDWGGLHLGHKQDEGVSTCVELWERPYVMVDGRVAPCCFVVEPCLGNFHEQTFDEIWFGRAYEMLRKQHLTNRHPAICVGCQQLMYTVASPSALWGKRKPKHVYAKAFMATSLWQPLTNVLHVSNTGRQFLQRLRQSGWRSACTLATTRFHNLCILGRIRLQRRARVQCPQCGWDGYAFYAQDCGTYAIPNEVCPHCGSTSIDRLFALCIKQRDTSLLADFELLLQFPPEISPFSLLRCSDHWMFIRAEEELEPVAAQTGSPLRSRLTSPENVYDAVVCLGDARPLGPWDSVGLAEIHRVLKPGGTAYVAAVSGETPREHWRVLGPGAAEPIDAAALLQEDDIQRYGVSTKKFMLWRLSKDRQGQ